MRIRTAVGLGIVAAVLMSGRGDAQAQAGRAQQTSTPSAGAQQPADQAQPAQQPPVFRAGINFVRVDVIVTDKNGEAITNLAPSDFEIVEEGKAQQIE